MAEPETSPDSPESLSVASGRSRLKPGERRIQILQTLAQMLEQPGGERITTAALAARLQVSEAALYRHFASKAQMFEGLIDFIEQSVFALVNQVQAQANQSGATQAANILVLLMRFAEKNPGMARVMVGDALVLEHERLQQRMNLFFDKLESSLKQCLRHQTAPEDAPSPDAQVRASVLLAFARGRLQRYVRSGFKRSPAEQLDACLSLLLSP